MHPLIAHVSQYGIAHPYDALLLSGWKRFSNTVSVIVLVPVANNCAIVTVLAYLLGNLGEVVHVSWFQLIWTDDTDSRLLRDKLNTHFAYNLEITGWLCSATVISINTSPFVTAAATMNVPASIRSGIIEESFHPNVLPLQYACFLFRHWQFLWPILFKIFAKSTISGSRVFKVCCSFAKVAAIIMFLSSSNRWEIWANMSLKFFPHALRYNLRLNHLQNY